MDPYWKRSKTSIKYNKIYQYKYNIIYKPQGLLILLGMTDQYGKVIGQKINILKPTLFLYKN